MSGSGKPAVGQYTALWQRRQGLPEETPPPASAPTLVQPSPRPEEQDYRPWGLELHQDTSDDTIEIRYGGEEWMHLHRAHRVRTEGAGDRFLVLLTSSCAVMLTGRGLSELRRLLRAGKLDFIEEFNPARWPPLAPGTPVIERVEILYAEGSLGETAAAARPNMQ